MGFQLGNLYVEKGQKTCGFLKLPFTEDELLDGSYNFSITLS